MAVTVQLCMLGSIKQGNCNCVLLTKLMRVNICQDGTEAAMNACVLLQKCCLRLQVYKLEPCVTPFLPASYAQQVRSFTSETHKWDTYIYVRSDVLSVSDAYSDLPEEACITAAQMRL